MRSKVTDYAIRRKRRWSDNDHHFGPLRPISAVISSGSSERRGGCHIRFQAFGGTMICELPQVIKPWRRWVDLRDKEWANGDGYWDEHPREYGFTLSDGHLHIKLGAQTMDSSTTQDWGCFLPWTQWRQIANRIYNADGSLAGDVNRLPWDERTKIIEGASKVAFWIDDFDNERIKVTTYIEDGEWRLGTGWFRWLGYLRTKRVRRSLDLNFSNEVGPEKGSWKGGMLGTGITMLPGEDHEQAFRRFCDEDHRSKYRTFRVTFVSRADD